MGVNVEHKISNFVVGGVLKMSERPFTQKIILVKNQLIILFLDSILTSTEVPFTRLVNKCQILILMCLQPFL
jgi:hypothetical protein